MKSFVKSQLGSDYDVLRHSDGIYEVSGYFLKSTLELYKNITFSYEVDALEMLELYEELHSSGIYPPDTAFDIVKHPSGYSIVSLMEFVKPILNVDLYKAGLLEAIISNYGFEESHYDVWESWNWGKLNGEEYYFDLHIV